MAEPPPFVDDRHRAVTVDPQHFDDVRCEVGDAVEESAIIGGRKSPDRVDDGYRRADLQSIEVEAGRHDRIGWSFVDQVSAFHVPRFGAVHEMRHLTRLELERPDLGSVRRHHFD